MSEQQAANPSGSTGRPVLKLAAANLLLGVLGNLVSGWVQEGLYKILTPVLIIGIVVLTVVVLVVTVWLEHGIPRWTRAHPVAQPLQSAYTDSSELHPNIILSSLQLLVWLFFNPSAWSNYVANTDPNLRSDFALAELSLAQWRNVRLRRLLVRGYIVWPLVAGLLTGLVRLLSSNERSVLEIVLGGYYGVAAAGVYGMIFGGLGSAAGGVALGALFSVISSIWPLVAGTMPNEVADLIGWLVVGIIFGTVAHVVASVASRGHGPPFILQLGLVLMNLLIDVVVCVAVITVPLGAIVIGWLVMIGHTFELSLQQLQLSAALGGVLIVGIAATVSTGWRTGKWLRGAGLGIVYGSLFGLTVNALNQGIITVPIEEMRMVADYMLRGIWYSTLFAICYVLTKSISNPWASAMAATVVAAAFYAFLYSFNSITPPKISLPVGSIGILLGLSLPLLGGRSRMLLRKFNLRLQRPKTKTMPADTAPDQTVQLQNQLAEMQRIPEQEQPNAADELRRRLAEIEAERDALRARLHGGTGSDEGEIRS